jgi:RimJ/RimL family protein N-acetyltransferase
MSDSTVSDYPKSITLPDGAAAEIRLMTSADRDAILAFAQALPQEDLLFLRLDLTQPEVVDEWVKNIATGHSTTLVGYADDNLIGYASVHRNPAPWTRRVGEIRVNVSRDYRARGLGKNMISEIFDFARGLGLRKLMANMTSDQHGAQAAFRRLGFVPEAILTDHVEDRNGVSRDMVIMTYDIDGHSDQVAGVVKI